MEALSKLCDFLITVELCLNQILYQVEMLILRLRESPPDNTDCAKRSVKNTQQTIDNSEGWQ